jgi:sec-independent protein translocase protein TatC
MLEYLIEIRRRAIKILILFGIFFTVLFFYADELFYFFVSPLIQALPNHHTLIATDVTAPLMTPIKLALNVAMLITTPIALFEVWQFISPGLYKHEKSHVKGIAVASFVLFFAGLGFCFFVVLPFILLFFANTVPNGVQYMPDMTLAIDFIVHMLLVFGLCFQVPLVCLLLTQFGLTDVSTLKTIRPYVIVSSFIIGMLLTPPDVLSQAMLALPLCLLYELGIVLSSRLSRKSGHSVTD